MLSQIDFLVFSHVVIDEIELANGMVQDPYLGGAGAYAAAGAALAAGPNRCAIISGVGTDLPVEAKGWLIDSGIATAGMPAVDAHTPRTVIRYHDDGERTESPRFGLDHFTLSEPEMAMVPENYQNAKGLYVFKAIDTGFWTDLRAYRARTNCAVLWEIDVAACNPEKRPHVLKQLADVDLLSINQSELDLLYADQPDLTRVQQVDELRAAGVEEVLLRRGAGGATVFGRGGAFAAAPPPGELVDPTGAGNAFGGAYLARWVDTDHKSSEALAAAMAGSAVTIRQYGPPAVSHVHRNRFNRLTNQVQEAVHFLEKSIK
ncbi:hypothetical protein ASG77_08650 [Arthrobacter sp. Soil762]|nr:hypothetical protein ASG77_08650 [Arthrobacter sp. Soil762]